MLLGRSFKSVVAAFAASVALAGCQTASMLSEPAGPDSALAILYMTVTLSGRFATSEFPATEVVIAQIDPAGGAEKEIKQTSAYDRYVIFANLAPGKYKVLRAVYTQKSAPGPMAPVGGGFAVGISFSPTATIEFQPEVVQRTLIEVPAGTVTYLGDFSATLKPQFAIPPRFEIDKSAGERTEGGRRRAHEMLTSVHAESRWALMLKPPVLGIYAGDLWQGSRQTTGSSEGLAVLAVARDSPASKAGIMAGDVVWQIGDKAITNRQSFNEALEQYAGKTAKVKYVRYESQLEAEVVFNERM